MLSLRLVAIHGLAAWAVGFITASSLFAQSETPANLLPPTIKTIDVQNPPPAVTSIVDPMVQPASGCCGSSGLPPVSGYSSYGCSGCGNGCVPGRKPMCSGCTSDSLFGRLCGGLMDELCCPDPCYEPMWIPAANAAFFQDSPRPVTQTRIRWDSAFRYTFPDTAEYFWARTGSGNKGPANASPSLKYNDLTLYQEIAAKGASAFVEMVYRSLDPVGNPGEAGLGDMNVGVKTVLLDRDLILVSMQIRTFIPSGNFTTGLGTGHVSLEPSLLSALRITPTTYLQTQFAEWIPLGGTSGFEGSTFHYHFSLNQNLCHHDYLNVVGTLELNGFSYRGEFTDPDTGVATPLSGFNYVNIGPGVRVQFCEQVDIGVGAAFGLTHHGPGQIYRTELRIRF
jgi:hypothetical protein